GSGIDGASCAARSMSPCPKPTVSVSVAGCRAISGSVSASAGSPRVSRAASSVSRRSIRSTPSRSTSSRRSRPMKVAAAGAGVSIPAWCVPWNGTVCSPCRGDSPAADGARTSAGERVVVRSGPRRSLVTPVVLVRIVPSAAVGGAGADGALGLVVLLGAGEVLHGGGEGVLGAVLELEDHLHLVPGQQRCGELHEHE